MHSRPGEAGHFLEKSALSHSSLPWCSATPASTSPSNPFRSSSPRDASLCSNTEAQPAVDRKPATVVRRRLGRIRWPPRYHGWRAFLAKRRRGLTAWSLQCCTTDYYGRSLDVRCSARLQAAHMIQSINCRCQHITARIKKSHIQPPASIAAAFLGVERHAANNTKGPTDTLCTSDAPPPSFEDSLSRPRTCRDLAAAACPKTNSQQSRNTHPWPAAR